MPPTTFYWNQNNHGHPSKVSLPWEKLQPLGDSGVLTGDPAVMLGDLQRQEEHCRSWVNDTARGGGLPSLP